LRGRLVDEQRAPLPGHRVVIAVDKNQLLQPHGATVGPLQEEWSATTDADGRIELRGLPGEIPLALSVYRGLHRILHREAAVVASTGAETRLEWQIGSLGGLEGKVVDQHDAPITGIDVALMPIEAGAEPSPLDLSQILPGSLRTVEPDGSFV